MAYVTRNGKPAFKNGKPILDPACCCGPGECFKACFYIRVSEFPDGLGPEEPTVTPPLTTEFADGTARVVYHGHSTDDATSGFQYHQHVWILEYCFTPLFHTTPDRVSNDYIAALISWVNNELSLDWNGYIDDSPGDIVGRLADCETATIQTKIDEALDTPGAETRTDIIALLPRDGCPDCEEF